MAAPVTPAYRAVTKFVLLAVAAWIGWKAITVGLATAYQVDDAALAAKLDPGNAAAALVLARQAADQEPDLRARAREVVLGVLAKRPADGRLFRALAWLDPDDPALTGRRWRVAAQLRPADVEALAWLADDAIARGDYAAGLEHCDALLRVSPGQAGNLFPILAQWLQTDARAGELARTLERRPPWRRSFAEYVGRKGSEKSLYYLVYIAMKLRHGSAPMDASEVRDLVNRLVHGGDFERAYLLWRSAMPPLQTQASMLHNGGLESPPGGTAFDWTLRATPGVAVAVEHGSGAHGNVLRLRFGGARVGEIGVAQTLLLPPGGYRVLGQVRSQDFSGAGSLEWRVYCLVRPSRLVVAAPLAPERDSDWSDFSLDLDVPEEGCPAQLLQLAHARTARPGNRSAVLSGSTISASKHNSLAPALRGVMAGLAIALLRSGAGTRLRFIRYKYRCGKTTRRGRAA